MSQADTAADDDPRPHDNPIDVSDVSDVERAEMLAEYIDRFETEFGKKPLLMPLDSEGKAPIIQDRCSLDSPEGKSLLVPADEAIEQIREESARGFAIYAGKESHNTSEAAFIDHDDSEAFPTPTGDPTLEVLSGSGRGPHETYRNDPDDPVANAKVGDGEGEIRAENWYVVTPGSIHPSGGIYHITEDRPIATISDGDLDDRMRPATDLSDIDSGDVPSREGEKSHAKRVAEHYNNIKNYLAFGSNDRSSDDFHVCCRMIEHGVDKGEVYRLLANNSNCKVDAPDAASDYWQRTWQRAKRKVGDDANTKALPQTSGGGNDTDDTDLPVPSSFDVRNGGYAKFHPPRDDDSDGYYEQITNFQIETLSRLTHDDGSREYELKIHPAEGESYTVTCEPVVFNDINKFKREVLDGWTATFDGGQSDLNRLKEFVGEQQAKHRIGTKLIGLHGDEFVTPDGSLTADGWTDDPNTVFTDVETPLSTAFNLKPSEGADYDRENVREILRLLPQTRTVERFLPVIGWFYAAPFRPYIQQWKGEFNILNVLGDTGSGKTTTLETLWQAFGVDEQLPEVKGSQFSNMRMMSSGNAVPVILDEYKPSEIPDYELDKLHAYLRESTRCGIVTKGRPDMSVDRYPLRAPVCVSGEQPIKGPAEERRSILTVFKRDVTVGQTPEQRAYAKLVGGEANGEWYDGCDLSHHALAYYQWVLQQDPDELHELWKDSLEYAIDVVHQAGHSDLDDIVIQGFQTIKFGCTLYRAFANEMGVNPDATPVTTENVKEAIEYVADSGNGAEHTSHLDRLLGLMTRAASAGYLKENEHYKIVHQGKENAELAIHFDTAFDMVRKYARDHDVRGDDLLSSAGDYKARIEDAAENATSYVTTYSQNSPPLGRCVRFHINDAMSLVEGFEPKSFGATVEENETHSDRFNPVSIHDVADDPTGYPTVKGEIKAIDYPEGDDSPALKATLVDGKTAIDVISWDDGSCLEHGEQVIIENADTSEFNGTTQLVIKDGVTVIHEAPDDEQRQIDDPEI